jgi:hypothetical protein
VGETLGVLVVVQFWTIIRNPDPSSPTTTATPAKYHFNHVVRDAG